MYEELETVKIVLKEYTELYSDGAPRCILIPLLPRVGEELKRMEENSIIERVTEPTEWVTLIVPVIKPFAPCPQTVSAITSLEPPKNVSELNRVLGMVNYVTYLTLFTIRMSC